MEYPEIAKQVVDFQKVSFNHWYSSVSVVQDQTRTAVGLLLDQTAWMPAEGRQAIQGWLDVCQEERNRFKAYVDQTFAGLEKLLVVSKKGAAPQRAKESATT